MKLNDALQNENPLDAEPFTVCVVDGCNNKFRTQWKTFGIPMEMTYEEYQKQPVMLRREHCAPCSRADPEMKRRWIWDFMKKNKDALIANGNISEENYNKRKQEMEQ